MSKSTSANLDLFLGESPVKPETRKEKKAKQAVFGLRSEGMAAPTMRALWKERSSIQSKRVHWSASGSTQHVACGVPTAISEGTILVELVNCEPCQAKAKEAWERLIVRFVPYDDEEDGE